jgi:hypothetical protein
MSHAALSLADYLCQLLRVYTHSRMDVIKISIIYIFFPLPGRINCNCAFDTNLVPTFYSNSEGCVIENLYFIFVTVCHEDCRMPVCFMSTVS